MSELAVGDSSKLPASWDVAAIDEVASINPKLAEAINDSDQVHFVPMAAVAEDFGGMDVSANRPYGEVRKGYTYFASQDVLFAKITPCMENGKGALVPELARIHAFGSTEFHVLRSHGAVRPKWLACYLSQPDFRKAARHNMTGTAGQLRVPTKWLSASKLPVPPLAEQDRILEKLEELLSDLDAGVAELKAAQRKLAQYRQSLLKAAVEGALTADWRAARARSGEPQETGADLLQRILTERRARWEAKQLAKYAEQGKTSSKGWQAKYPEPVTPYKADVPALPEGWVWASIDQIGDVTTGFTPSTSNPLFFGGDIPFFKPTDLDAGYDVRDFRESLTILGSQQGRVLPARSVLVTCIGATIGKTGLARVPCATNQQINAISPIDQGALPEFIYFVMTSDFGQRQVIGSASATTLPILNKSKFEKLPLPLPGKGEQLEIVRYIEDRFTEIARQEEAISLALKQAAAQRKNILKAAFAGQLVPQDSNDEPASALLERIRAERARQSGAAKPRGRKPRTTA